MEVFAGIGLAVVALLAVVGAFVVVGAILDGMDIL